MPFFGRSLFETVLDGLEQQDGEDDDEVSSPSIRGFNGGFVGGGHGSAVESSIDPSALFDGFPPDAVVVEPPVPVWLDRLSEADIAADLSLATCSSESELKEKRRLFARDNHPDRVSVDYHEQATRRMMIANQLIDAALSKLR